MRSTRAAPNAGKGPIVAAGKDAGEERLEGEARGECLP